jgi:hypothetical protein
MRKAVVGKEAARTERRPIRIRTPDGEIWFSIARKGAAESEESEVRRQ